MSGLDTFPLFPRQHSTYEECERFHHRDLPQCEEQQLLDEAFLLRHALAERRWSALPGRERSSDEIGWMSERLDRIRHELHSRRRRPVRSLPGHAA